jgi:5-methylcytosine-specific restriction endonuclease McrA
MQQQERLQMRDYSKVAPTFWTDHFGNTWRTPQILGRLKFRIPCHAALREFVLHRFGYECLNCGSKTNLVADHIISRANGGAHHPDNMQCLCNSCNAIKANTVDRIKKVAP